LPGFWFDTGVNNVQPFEMAIAKKVTVSKNQILALLSCAKQGTFPKLIESKPKWVTRVALSTSWPNAGPGRSAEDSGWTPLHVAARHRHLDQIKPWITKEDLLLTTASGLTPIFVAAQHECLWQLPKRLLTKRLMLTSIQGHPTPLMVAAKTRRIEDVPPKILTVENLTVLDSAGRSPLQEIAEGGDLDGLPDPVKKALAKALPAAKWSAYEKQSNTVKADREAEIARRIAASPDGVPF
jgi:hypothetical protein